MKKTEFTKRDFKKLRKKYPRPYYFEKDPYNFYRTKAYLECKNKTGIYEFFIKQKKIPYEKLIYSRSIYKSIYGPKKERISKKRTTRFLN